MVSSLLILSESPSPTNKMHNSPNESNLFAALLLDDATICSLFTPCIAYVALLHESNIWNNFSSFPRLCYSTGIMEPSTYME